MEDINKVRIYDAGGAVYDRYTIIFVNRKSNKLYYEALAASRDPYHPQGFGMHCSAAPGSHLGKRVHWRTLPADVQRFAREAFPEFAPAAEGGAV